MLGMIQPAELLCRSGFSFKKTLMAAERERADISQERDEWCKHRQPAMQQSPGFSPAGLSQHGG
ncbi:hypothetical protein [Neorhizobium sp. LjRoot104]|uniref:hypothetical protein n=1 Tax=Neorhizobium sp. LjRoot104 TaxID=3342254 RepID=UPI003ECFEC9F